MSLRLFIGYFVVLSACATIAFASSMSAKPDPQQSAAATASVPAEHHLRSLIHRGPTLKTTLLACAQ